VIAATAARGRRSGVIIFVERDRSSTSNSMDRADDTSVILSVLEIVDDRPVDRSHRILITSY